MASIYTYKTIGTSLIECTISLEIENEASLNIEDKDFNTDRIFQLKNWQKDQNINIQVELHFDEEDKESIFSVIRPDRDASIYVIYHSASSSHSSGTSISGLCSKSKLDSGINTYTLTGQIPGVNIAGNLEISIIISIDSIHLPTLKVLKKEQVMMAKEIGSKLFEKTVLVNLEGKVSYFPTEDFDFAKEGFPSNALYFLNRRNCSLDADFVTKYTLFFNNQHPEYYKINSSSENMNDFLQLIKLDIYKEIINDALDNKAFSYSIKLTNDSQSVNDVYTRLVKNISDNYFDGVELNELRNYAKPNSNYYNKFLMALQDSVLNFGV